MEVCEWELGLGTIKIGSMNYVSKRKACYSMALQVGRRYLAGFKD